MIKKSFKEFTTPNSHIEVSHVVLKSTKSYSTVSHVDSSNSKREERQQLLIVIAFATVGFFVIAFIANLLGLLK